MSTPCLILESILSPDRLRSQVSAAEWAEAEGFGSLQRQREWLSWRALVHRVLGADAEVRYNAVGAPYVVGSSCRISVSHSKGCVAVLFSDRQCAVDVERLDRNFQRIKAKYLTAEEQRLGDDVRFLAAAWSAKEALYKYAGEPGLDLLEDLHVLAYEPGVAITGQIKDGEPLRLSIALYDTLDDGPYQAVYLG